MNRLLASIIITATALSASFAGGEVVVKVVSESTGEGLPYSVLDLEGVRPVVTDSAGQVFLGETPDSGTLYVSSFNHQGKTVPLRDLCGSDTILVRLSPAFRSLEETVVRPLVKEKEITKGQLSPTSLIEFKDKPNFQYNKKKFRELGPEEKWVTPGIIIKSKKNKLNVLKAFGVNVVACDTMLPVFRFRLMIYDISGEKPEGGPAVPVCAPIFVEMRKESVTEEGFRHEFADPIPLPPKAAILVDFPGNESNGDGVVNMYSYPLDGHWFYFHDPYHLTERHFGMRRSDTLFFYEYTQYALPRD